MKRVKGSGGLLLVLAAVVVLAVLSHSVMAPAANDEVNIYSYRQEVLIRPLLVEFTRITGIKVNLVSGKADALLERLKAEGQNSPADVLLTVDAGRLIRAREAGVLRAITSSVLEAGVPPQYRDPEGYWFGLSVRARPLLYAIGRVRPEELPTYEALTEPGWKGRICVRSSNNIYNQSMLAATIAHLGAEAAEAWARALVANFARAPKGGDRDQIRAVAAGECDVTIVNTYYLARLAHSPKEGDRKVAAKVAIAWPNQQGRGTHVNISGAAVTKSAKNVANAVKLLEFLVSDGAQKIYAEVVYEYPVKNGVPRSDVVNGWGAFKADTLNLAALGEYNALAVRIADRVGWR